MESFNNDFTTMDLERIFGEMGKCILYIIFYSTFRKVTKHNSEITWINALSLPFKKNAQIGLFGIVDTWSQ